MIFKKLLIVLSFFMILFITPSFVSASEMSEKDYDKIFVTVEEKESECVLKEIKMPLEEIQKNFDPPKIVSCVNEKIREEVIKELPNDIDPDMFDFVIAKKTISIVEYEESIISSLDGIKIFDVVLVIALVVIICFVARCFSKKNRDN